MSNGFPSVGVENYVGVFKEFEFFRISFLILISFYFSFWY